MESLFIILLGLTSLVGVTFIVERGLALRWNKVLPSEVAAAVEACREPGDLASLRRVCEQYPSALSSLLVVAADHLDWPKAENVDAVQTRARREIMRLERGLVVLEIVVGIAPLLGLEGTIFGMMILFGDMGMNATPDASTLAKGISQILNSTLLGLLIAIPALIAWSYYNKKVENLAVEMETLCTEFMRRQYRHRSAE